MGATAFNVTIAGEDVPAAIEVEVTVTALTEVAVLELPVAAGVPLLDGEPENAPLETVPQPMKFVTAKSMAAAIPSEHVPKLSLNPLAHIGSGETPKLLLKIRGKWPPLRHKKNSALR